MYRFTSIGYEYELSIGGVPGYRIRSADMPLLDILKIRAKHLSPIGTGQHKYKSQYKIRKSEVDLF
eukprot:SAG31_NODE_130_length_23424_cov_45.648802_13_plen_66_part_00